MMMICTASLQNIHNKQLKGYQSTTEEKKDKQPWPLSPGQMDWQVVAGGRELNLCRDLHWVAKQTCKFPHKYMQVAKKTC